MKSTVTTIALNAWAWIKFPWMKFITISYGGDLAVGHSVATRDLIVSTWYQKNWGGRFRLKGDQNVKSWFGNNKGGFRKSAGVGGPIHGKGGDIIIMDDGLDPKRANSEVEREGVARFWDGTVSTRLNNLKTGTRIVIEQRLHESDLTGHILETNPSKYKHIRIPAEDKFDINPPELKKFYKAGLFFPARFGRKELDDILADLKPTGYANQFGQSPSPADGIIFKAPWMVKRWTKATLPEFEKIVCSWDLTFGSDDEESGESLNAGGVWGIARPDIYLLWAEASKMEFTEQVKAILRLRGMYANTDLILIENKAAGAPAISTLRKTIPGVMAWPPKGSTTMGSKIVRASSVTGYFEGGNVYLPDENEPGMAWVVEYVKQLLSFPKGKLNDFVDMTSQFLNWFRMANVVRDRRPRERYVETTNV